MLPTMLRLVLYSCLLLVLTQSDTRIHVAHPNHRSSSANLSKQRHLGPPTTRINSSSTPQTLKSILEKRSGDYHPMDHVMDYPQYETTDDHGHRTPFFRQVSYARYPVYDKPSSRFDISSIGILAIVKIALLKIVAFGFFKLIVLFLIKFPLLLFALGFKFLIIMKLIKLVKLLTIPIVIPIILVIIFPILVVVFFVAIPLILPLILAPVIPLILIPILLPLLLNLPVPVLAPASSRHRRHSEDSIQSRSVQEDVLYLVRRVLESEQCIERVACQLAANKQSRSYAAYVAWRMSAYECVTDYMRHLLHVFDDRIMVQGIGVSVDW